MKKQDVSAHVQTLSPIQFDFFLKMFCRFGLPIIEKSGLLPDRDMTFLKKYISGSGRTAHGCMSGCRDTLLLR